MTEPSPQPVVERPGVTVGAASRADLHPETDPRLFPCPQCGADLEYAIGQEALRCVHCGYDRAIEVQVDERVEEQDYAATLERLEALRREQRLGEAKQEVIRCEACSAEVTFDETVTSTECPYCGQPVQRDRVHTATDRIPVDGVLPFAIDRQRAQKNLSRWLKKLWFAPTEFTKRGLRGRFEGVFLPYFTFDALTFTRFVGQRGTRHTRRVGSGKNARTVVETTWQRVAGKFQRFFDDVLALGARDPGVPKIRRLEPWPLEKAKPFRAEFLAGFVARTYDRTLEEAFGEARGRIERALEADVRARIGGDEQRIESIDTRYDAITYKHLLLPLWLMTYRYRERTFQVVINAVTGEVYGQRPYSGWKIFFAVVLALLAVLFLVFVFGR